MLRLRRGAILLGLLFAGAAAHAGLDGLWRTEHGDAHIEIAPCDDHYCGTVVWLKEPLDDQGEIRRDPKNKDPALRDRLLRGIRILTDVPLEPDEEQVWTGGRLYDPKSGRVYRCTIRRDGPDRLRIRGFWGISLLGRNTQWTRLDPGAPTRPQP